MTQNALILKGNLSLGGSNIATSEEASEEVTAFKLSFARDVVNVPATLSKGKRNLSGSVLYSIEIGYLSSDIATAVFRLLYAAAISATGELFFVGSMRDDSVSTANPRYCGTMIVTQADLGGDALGLSTGSATFALKGAPIKETA